MEEIQIKYWIFYLKDDNDECDIYAYTDDKDLAYKFKTERNMEIFICDKKKLNKRQISYLADEYQNKILKSSSFKTYDGEIGEYIPVSIAVTVEEEINVFNISFNLTVALSLSKYCWYNPLIFKDEIINALNTLQYNEYYNYISSDNTDKDNKPNVISDELGIFIRYYGKSLK